MAPYASEWAVPDDTVSGNHHDGDMPGHDGEGIRLYPGLIPILGAPTLDPWTGQWSRHGGRYPYGSRVTRLEPNLPSPRHGRACPGHPPPDGGTAAGAVQLPVRGWPGHARP